VLLTLDKVDANDITLNKMKKKKERTKNIPRHQNSYVTHYLFSIFGRQEYDIAFKSFDFERT
jgi:hypothetical protein